MFRRVANFVGQTDKERHIYYDMMKHLQFIPNTPALCNAGVPSSSGQLFACFVLGLKDSMWSIFTSLRDMAIIQKTGGGTGFCFSKLRPSGAAVSSTQGIASGPISFMHAFDAATNTIKQGGVRRGANMGCLHVWHPNIAQFIKCKDEPGVLPNFNISVLITNDFMEAVKADKQWELKFDDVVYDTVRVRELWNMITYQAWKNGEPGVIFIDEINAKHPLIYPIEATNPCGEQPLLVDEACDLGHVNLSEMVVGGKFDFKLFADTIHWGVRFLDECIDVNTYPLRRIESVVKHNRKVGLGVMGYADMLIKLGLKYGSPEATRFTKLVAGVYQAEAESATINLAKEKGPCAAYINGETTWQVPVRNSTVTTIAPTGTTSIIAKCSSSIEPIFSPWYVTNRLDQQFAEYHPLFKQKLIEMDLLEYFESALLKNPKLQLREFNKELADLFIGAHQVTPDQHVQVQALWQKHVHNAISKTINLPHKATVRDVADAYLLAYDLKCKGVTVYRDGSRGGVLLTTEAADEEVELPTLEEGQLRWTCPECGSSNIGYQSGCNFCRECGFSPCG
jgi:ribonucleoside-diphosphate reductase alpha chain